MINIIEKTDNTLIELNDIMNSNLSRPEQEIFIYNYFFRLHELIKLIETLYKNVPDELEIISISRNYLEAYVKLLHIRNGNLNDIKLDDSIHWKKYYTSSVEFWKNNGNLVNAIKEQQFLDQHTINVQTLINNGAKIISVYDLMLKYNIRDFYLLYRKGSVVTHSAYTGVNYNIPILSDLKKQEITEAITLVNAIHLRLINDIKTYIA